MQDELDGQLRRQFALSHRPLADAQFVARVTGQLHARASLDSALRVLNGSVRAILSGLAVGITAPLRLRHAGLLALAAAAVAVCTALQSSL
jgi:hypothetical protein